MSNVIIEKTWSRRINDEIIIEERSVRIYSNKWMHKIAKFFGTLIHEKGLFEYVEERWIKNGVVTKDWNTDGLTIDKLVAWW